MVLASGLARLENLPAEPRYVEGSSPVMLARELKERILYSPDSIASRNKRLIHLARDSSGDMTPDLAMIFRLATEVVRMPSWLSEVSVLSRTIRRIHHIILVKLEARENKISEDLSTVGGADVETCEICSHVITFESLRWARCSNGHQFCKFSPHWILVAALTVFSSVSIILPLHPVSQQHEELHNLRNSIPERIRHWGVHARG